MRFKLSLFAALVLLVLPTAAQAQQTSPERLADVRDALGSDCQSADADKLRGEARTEIACVDGKVAQIIERPVDAKSPHDVEAIYTRPELGRGQKLGRDDYVSVTQPLVPGSGTGCHDQGSNFYVPPPGDVDGSNPYRFQQASGGGIEDFRPTVNLTSLTTLKTTNMAFASTGQPVGGPTSVQNETSLQWIPEVEAALKDWAYLRNGWCKYQSFPANNGWYQDLGSWNSNNNASGIDYAPTWTSTGVASSLPSCYRGVSHGAGHPPDPNPYGYLDGSNVVQGINWTGWNDGAGQCLAVFSFGIGAATTTFGAPLEATTCPGAFCAWRIVEWDIAMRNNGFYTGTDLMWCLETQSGWCDAALVSQEFDTVIMSAREVLDHEIGHPHGLDHSGYPQNIMYPSGTPMGAGAHPHRIGCPESVFMQFFHKPFNTTDDPYPIGSPSGC